MSKDLHVDKSLCISFSTVDGLEMFAFGTTVDELIDELLIVKDIKFINKFVHQFLESLSEEHFLRLDPVVLNSNDSDAITEYAILRASSNNVMDFIDVLIRQKSWNNIIKLSEKFNSVCFDKIEDAIIQFAEPRFISLLSLVDGVNLLKLKNALKKNINFSDFYNNYFFNFYNFCKKHQFKAGIVTKDDIKVIEDFFNYFPYDDIILDAASFIKGINISKLQNQIISNGDPCSIYNFARHIKDADIELLRSAMWKTRNFKFICKYYRAFPDKSLFSFLCSISSDSL